MLLSEIAERASRPQIQPLAAGDPAELGGYEIRGRIGNGGMGAVYLGATRSGRLLAIKVIRPEYADEHEFRARFRREVSAATRVRSRRTAAVIDFDVDAAVPWLATEYVSGPTLAQVIAEQGALPADAVRELVAGLAEALDTVHRDGLVHRDVKPGNVLLSPDGPVLIDMGIVSESEATSLTTTGLQPGTPQYMSPEQARGTLVGPPSDVWSVGAVAYLAATGRAPFGTGTLAAMTYRIVHDAPAILAVPDPLRPIVEACLAKDPAARPTPAVLLRSLTGPAAGADLPLYQAGDPTGTDTLDDPTQLRGRASESAAAATVPDAVPTRSRRGLVIGLVAAGLVLVAGGAAAASWYFLGPDDTPPAVAQTATSSPPPQSPSPKQKKEKSPKPTPSPSATPASNATHEPVPAPQAFTPGTVSIPEDVQVGQTLSAQTDGWTPQPAEQTCTWNVGGSVGSAGSCSYTVRMADVGKTIQVDVTAARDGYETSSAQSNQTGAVPQPQVPRPSCSIYWTAGVVHEGWFGHCDVDQQPDVTYRWQWLDAETGEIVSKDDYQTGPRGWINGRHAGKQIVCVVTAEREGYRSSKATISGAVPAQWQAAG